MVTAHFKVPHKLWYRWTTQNQATFSFTSQVLGKNSNPRLSVYNYNTCCTFVQHHCISV